MKSFTFITAFLCLAVMMEVNASEEETRAIKEALKDINRLDVIRRQRSDLEQMQTGKARAPRKKTHQEKCVENALKLALRHPDSELSHAVCANIVEENVAKEQIDEMFQRLRNACEKNQTNELRLCRKRLDELEDSRDKLSKKLWQDDLCPIVSKVLFASPDCRIYIPASVVKDESDRINNGYTLYDNAKGRLSFKGFEIGASTNTCAIVSCQRQLNWATCQLNEDFLGLKRCTVSYNSLGHIRGLHFMFYPTTKSEYDKTLDNVVNEVCAMVEYKNKTFSYSESSDIGTKEASFTLNIFKDRRRYVIRIDQSHMIFENRIMHFIALRVLFGNDVTSTWNPPEDGIHLGAPTVSTKAEVAKRNTLQNKNARLCKREESDTAARQDGEIERKSRKKRAKVWSRNHFRERPLTQYKSSDQRLRRNQLSEVSMLLAEMAVAYGGKGFDHVFDDGASTINKYYKIDRTNYWSRGLGDEGLAALEGDIFSQEIGDVLDSLRVVFKELGTVDDLKKRHDRLSLQVKYSVNTSEELQQKIVVQKAWEEKMEKERLFQQEERRIRAEENTADAIRHQTMDVYHHW